MKRLLVGIICILLSIACSKKQAIVPFIPKVIEYSLTSTDTSTYLITYSDSTSKLVTVSFSGDVWTKIITKISPDLTVSDFLVENKDPWISQFSGQIAILINGKVATTQSAQFSPQNTDFFCYFPLK